MHGPRETERLRLRFLTEEDAPFILQHLNQPTFIENIRDSGVRSLEDARKYVRNGPLRSYEAHGFGLMLVELKEDRTPIGMCGLLKRKTLDHPDLGFALDPPFWGHGYASEAAQAAVEDGFARFDLPEILAITSPGNTRSIRLLSAMGFADLGERPHADHVVRMFCLRRQEAD